ncbi:Quinone oxidoreductase [Rasamsonia emersonii CBS 393.64]|uniref:Quinone oxidoreductase n=1 Tax=Rasamsonia emersonii (strain ATCC 16479 / CBS 393.64 / IMI 116815) TaxID=1408163 RepID=A0A0F4YZK8_RASE3|nr:Quinone oxidoreductase [Rasamsonia emersonii CBS 393.64]KKA23550.1 Quinone oxidoreductase [Rasamsonia emersonii CBS 393.64]
MQREDRYPYPLLPESGNILGVEFSGVVEEKGPECSDSFQIGDRVFGLAYGGAYAQKIVVSEKMLLPLPPSLSFEEAAGAPETFFTAIQAIHLVGNLQPGQTVLIHAGASGVGQSAIQVAKFGGASTIITTAGSDEKCQLCRTLGADIAVNYRTEDFAEVVRTATKGRGVDLIVDLVGQNYWHRNTACAAMDGRIVLVAALSGSKIADFDLRALLNKRLWVQATTLRTRDAAYQARVRDFFAERILPHLSKGEMRTVVDKVYDWRDVSEAHKRLESNAHAGKIICRVTE